MQWHPAVRTAVGTGTMASPQMGNERRFDIFESFHVVSSSRRARRWHRCSDWGARHGRKWWCVFNGVRAYSRHCWVRGLRELGWTMKPGSSGRPRGRRAEAPDHLGVRRDGAHRAGPCGHFPVARALPALQRRPDAYGLSTCRGPPKLHPFPKFGKQSGAIGLLLGGDAGPCVWGSLPTSRQPHDPDRLRHLRRGLEGSPDGDCDPLVDQGRLAAQSGRQPARSE